METPEEGQQEVHMESVENGNDVNDDPDQEVPDVPEAAQTDGNNNTPAPPVVENPEDVILPVPNEEPDEVPGFANTISGIMDIGSIMGRPSRRKRRMYSGYTITLPELA